jgi:formylglycine-generating enzyme required for sulfatase activity
LVRLFRRLRWLPVMERTPERAALEERVAALLAAGVQPVAAEVVNSIGLRLALVPPGRFRMGSPEHEVGRSDDEGPLHEVEITRAFFFAVFPVTQGEYLRIMGNNPAHFSPGRSAKKAPKTAATSAFPVETVSWHEAAAFCDRLSALPGEREAGRVYRLPTEAEWEYACRAGTSSTFHFGDSLSSRQSNVRGDSPYGGGARGPYIGRTCPVGSYRPNAFGLYDFHGNVYEWCGDWYDDRYYQGSPGSDPAGTPTGTRKVLRDGSWADQALACRSANRNSQPPHDRNMHVGFRVVCVRAGPGAA